MRGGRRMLMLVVATAAVSLVAGCAGSEGPASDAQVGTAAAHDLASPDTVPAATVPGCADVPITFTAQFGSTPMPRSVSPVSVVDPQEALLCAYAFERVRVDDGWWSAVRELRIDGGVELVTAMVDADLAQCAEHPWTVTDVWLVDGSGEPQLVAPGFECSPQAAALLALVDGDPAGELVPLVLSELDAATAAGCPTHTFVHRRDPSRSDVGLDDWAPSELEGMDENPFPQTAAELMQACFYTVDAEHIATFSGVVDLPAVIAERLAAAQQTFVDPTPCASEPTRFVTFPGESPLEIAHLSMPVLELDGCGRYLHEFGDSYAVPDGVVAEITATLASP